LFPVRRNIPNGVQAAIFSYVARRREPGGVFAPLCPVSVSHSLRIVSNDKQAWVSSFAVEDSFFPFTLARFRTRR